MKVSVGPIIVNVNRPCCGSGLGLAVRSIQGSRRKLMAQVPPIEIVDVEKVQLSIAPRDEDGRPVTAGPFQWGSSDSSVITLDPAADGLSAFAISGAPGVATVTVSNADGSLADSIEITVKLGAPSSLNLSAGPPVRE